jgi:hypothetical protein
MMPSNPLRAPFAARHLLASTVVLSLALAWSPEVLGQQPPRLPYLAYVQQDGARLRSGPGQQYYSTQEVSRGEAVEIYRHDPGGWLAIRPPENAFSWIDGQYLQVQPDGRGLVAANAVAVRIGSDESDIRDVIQVRLSQGEAVDIRDAKQLGAGEHARTWYKIAPPSGEFRWIHARDVDLAPPRKPEPQPSVAQEREPAPIISGVQPAMLAQAADPEPKPEAESSKPEAEQTAEMQMAELDLLHQELVAVVAGTPESWNFDRIFLGARRLLLTAQTPGVRSEARLILDRIETFEEIHRRYRRLDETTPPVDTAAAEPEPTPGLVRSAATRRPLPSETAVPASPTASARSQAMSESVAPSEADPRLDGQGLLNGVAARDFGQPHFVLMDPSGVAATYVTPAPGVNLNRYLGERIGVIGVRTASPVGGKPHVIVKRVVPLGE